MNRTICAISTPVGLGAIGIVRISGPDAIRLADELFQAADGHKVFDQPSHTLRYGKIVASGHIIDEALLILMRAPASYTREDVVELHCHGGPASVRAVLEAVSNRGVALAEPGEFTKRAFLNGRIDLTQAEAVMEVLQARTRAGLLQASRRLQGALGDRVRRLKTQLTEVAALVEASIDFPDDELEDLSDRIVSNAQEVLQQLEQLVQSASSGQLYRHGIQVVLAGRPNVGKSSLFNRLLRQARAIVTDEPGTTRDLIEQTINIQGVPVSLVDSAGLRKAQGKPEQMGVQFTKKAIARSDLVLLVVDRSQPLTAEDRRIAQDISAQGLCCLVVLNKSDLDCAFGSCDLAPGKPIPTSAQTGEGIESLERAIAELAFGGQLVPPQEALVASAREEDCLRRSRTALDSFRQAVLAGVSLEATALDLHSALATLGELTGEVTTEDLLDVIFGQFCIGK